MESVLKSERKKNTEGESIETPSLLQGEHVQNAVTSCTKGREGEDQKWRVFRAPVPVRRRGTVASGKSWPNGPFPAMSGVRRERCIILFVRHFLVT